MKIQLRKRMNTASRWYSLAFVISNIEEGHTLKVLVIGSGGREHAIARQFNVSPSVKKYLLHQAMTA